MSGTLSASAKYQTSRGLLEQARQSLAGGVSSPFRAKFPVPLYFRGGSGSHLEDEDGNNYIDYTLAWGPAILGHRHPKIVEAAAAHLDRPLIYGAQHRLEIEVAGRIQSMVPCAERAAFTSSGSEAVQLALRLARAATGRRLVLKFEGHYHGWMDSVLVSHHPAGDSVGEFSAPTPVLESKGQVPDAAGNLLVLPWNHAALVEEAFASRGGEIAALIMEPVMVNSGAIMPLPGYLERMRDIASAHGALLIFDEIITGFRMSLGGAQGFFGVTPDLATFGKAVGGGAPLSVVAGKKEILELMSGGGVSFGGTFNGNPFSLACAQATLEELARDSGAALAQANQMGRQLMEGLRGLAAERGLPLCVCGFGAAFALHFTSRTELIHYRDTFEDDPARLRTFITGMLDRGVYLLPDGRFYVSAAHAAEDIERTLAAAGEVLTEIAAARR